MPAPRPVHRTMRRASWLVAMLVFLAFAMVVQDLALQKRGSLRRYVQLAETVHVNTKADYYDESYGGLSEVDQKSEGNDGAKGKNQTDEGKKDVQKADEDDNQNSDRKSDREIRKDFKEDDKASFGDYAGGNNENGEDHGIAVEENKTNTVEEDGERGITNGVHNDGKPVEVVPQNISKASVQTERNSTSTIRQAEDENQKWKKKEEESKQENNSNNGQNFPERLFASSNLPPNATHIYSVLRPDRSGAAIIDMLLASAHAHKLGAVYEGACGSPRFETAELIQRLNLHQLLPVACPDNIKAKNRGKLLQKMEPYISDDPTVSPRIVKDKSYRTGGESDAGLFSVDFLRDMGVFLEKNMTFTKTQHNATIKSTPTIVVYVRRGDITPCGKYGIRYYPNSHYLALIDRYSERFDVKPRVIVFGTRSSFEPLDIFHERGYDLRLDAPLDEVWTTMIRDSDVLILSRSSFSVVPAVLRTALRMLQRDDRDLGTTVISSLEKPPLLGWEVAGRNLTSQKDLELKKLSIACSEKSK